MKIKTFQRAIQYVGWGFLASAVLGCGAVEDTASELKIYGGKKTKAGEWLNTVAITSGSGRMFCSGTVVHPRLVITAAHCVQGMSNPNSLRVYTGEGVEGGQVSPQYKAVKFDSSPKYGRNPGGWNDIAYIVVDKDIQVPSSAIVPILTDEEEAAELLKKGATSRIVGFGNRNGGGFGVKYETDAAVTSVNKNEVSIGNNGKDSCQGDSGGPAFGQLANGQWRVYGVVSRGGACGTGGIYGIMSANICWIQEDSGVSLDLPEGYCDKALTEDEENF
jgi:V8-like Glu-specific endopeptidase